MTLDPKLSLRLQFLVRVVGKESAHLASTDRRLFKTPFSRDTALQLESDPDLAERVEAFVGRFGRLRDTVGDKLLPALLAALGEPVGAAVDNLDRAERLGLTGFAVTFVQGLFLNDDLLRTSSKRSRMQADRPESGALDSAALHPGDKHLTIKRLSRIWMLYHELGESQPRAAKTTTIRRRSWRQTARFFKVRIDAAT